MEQLDNVQFANAPNKQIILYCQKIVRLESSVIKYDEHFEIFTRMVGKNGVLISPVKFFPLIEANLIISLDKWVLNESLSLIEERHKIVSDKTNKNYLYHLNLSAKTISDVGFIKYCAGMLVKNHHLAPYICFEISEATAMTNFEEVKKFIQAIHRFGCKFALDNFGSGGTKLDFLRKLPIDFVKIDGLYTSDVAENKVSQVIVESICKIANALKIQVIAEKVETIATEDILFSLGIQYIQGYKLQRPIPFVTKPFPH